MDRNNWCKMMIEIATRRNSGLLGDWQAMLNRKQRSWADEYENLRDNERWQEEFALMRLTGDVP